MERETVDALIEAREKLEAASDLLSGLRTLLASERCGPSWNTGCDHPERRYGDHYKFDGALRGALVLAYDGVQHANALIASILDKGR